MLENFFFFFFCYNTDEKTTQDLPDMCGEINADLVKLILKIHMGAYTTP